MYKRRVIVFLTIVGAVMGGLVGRLAYLQFVQGETYLKDAERYLREVEMMPPVRGRILDRQGRILAIDEPCYELCIEYPFLVAEPGDKWTRRQVRRIARTEGLDRKIESEMRWAEEIYRRRRAKTLELAASVARNHAQDLERTILGIKRRVGRIRKARGHSVLEEHQFHAVVRGLDEAEAVAVKSQLSEAMCMKVRPSHERRYPRGDTACHVIGLTGKADANRLAAANAELRRELRGSEDEMDWLRWRRDRYGGNDMMGNSGVEKLCEKFLRGRRGYRLHRRAKLIDDEAARAGGDVHLTLDAALQEELARAFTERHPAGTGAIVVLDVPSGQVLALVSIPTYDLNTYRRDLPALIAETTYLPLRHRAVAQAYAPGSAVKPVAALTALGSGRIGLETPFHCKGGYMFDSVRDRWRCWSAKKGFGHGRIALREGIRVSCNVYFYHVGEAMRPGPLCEWFRLFGFGAVPGTGLPEESSGVVPTDEWMRRRTDPPRGVSMGEARLMAIGQGPFSATPLQVANAMATIARGGMFSSPVLVLEGGPKRIRRELPMAEHHLRTVHDGMRDVVHHDKGTAHKVLMRNGLSSLGFEFCGKTGTAQVSPQRRDSDGDGRITRADEVVRRGDAAWFAGFAPYGDPKIAFAVLVEYVEGGGGENAGPVALDVLRICKGFGYVP